MHDPHVVCPKCSHQILLTESIAAPLLEAERRGFQEKLAARDAEFARKTDELRQQQADLAKAKESLDDEVSLGKTSRTRQCLGLFLGRPAIAGSGRNREKFIGTSTSAKSLCKCWYFCWFLHNSHPLNC
jgi:hypothetical protein